MIKWIVFLKAINVGGRNILPMAELRSLAQGIGCQDVVTYIQSGNCVLRSSHANPRALAGDLASAIADAKGFRPEILCLSVADLAEAIEGNPFQVDPSEGNKVHFLFAFEGDVSIDLEAVEKIRLPSEDLHFCGAVVYLHAPEGVGRSRLFAQLPKLIGQGVSARNLKTVLKMASL